MSLLKTILAKSKQAAGIKYALLFYYGLMSFYYPVGNLFIIILIDMSVT